MKKLINKLFNVARKLIHTKLSVIEDSRMFSNCNLVSDLEINTHGQKNIAHTIRNTFRYLRNSL